MSVTHRDLCTRLILRELQASDSVSQRALSRELRIALGHTNELLRRMVRSGWVEVVRQAPNKVRYVITPAGIAQEVIMSRQYFEDAVGVYREARERIERSLRALSLGWRRADETATPEKRVVFYGTGEVAEIAYVSLQKTDLQLVGVVDERASGTFFGLRPYPVTSLTATHLNGTRFDRLIVTSFTDPGRVPPPLSAAGLSPERFVWL